VADAAEAANHHPAIELRYNKVTLVLTTHSADRLTATTPPSPTGSSGWSATITTRQARPGRDIDRGGQPQPQAPPAPAPAHQPDPDHHP
jgi:Pterin 4 alpha carbinolamine dehydratase